MGRLHARPRWANFVRARPDLALPQAPGRPGRRRRRREYVPMTTIVRLVRDGKLRDYSRKARNRA